MSVYEYSCSSCSRRFEVRRPVGQACDERCPDCNSEAKRVFTPVGVVLKGEGFHATDYRPRKDGHGEQTPSATASEPACGTGCSECPAVE